MDFLEFLPKSNWIWVPDTEMPDADKTQLILFRRQFSLEKIPEQLNIRISGDTRYKLYVNGKFAEFGPVKGDQTLWYVDEVDLAPYLLSGENVLAIELLRYPKPHGSGNFGMFRSNLPGLYLAECEAVEAARLTEGPSVLTELDYPTAAEGAGWGISADARWKCHIVKGYEQYSESPFFAPLQILEKVSNDPQTAGWTTQDFDDSSWAKAQPYPELMVSQAVSPGNLLPRSIPSLKKVPGHFEEIVVRREASPKADRNENGPLIGDEEWQAMLQGRGMVHVPAHSCEILEISAGRETTGFLSLRTAGGIGASFEILTAECYSYPQEGGRFDMSLPKKGDRTDYVHGSLDGFSDYYRPAGFGSREQPEVYEPFWFRTFRYIRLKVVTAEDPVEICGFDYIETGYPLEVKTKVEVSDPSMQAIWDISLRTLQCCMHETYEDCPFYEQLQYAMDSRSQILYTYSVSADDRLARKCMDDFRRSQRYDGMINCSYPTTGPNVIPGFSIYYIMMVYDHMMYFGDQELVKKHYHAIDGVLGYFAERLDERGLVKKNGGPGYRSRYWSFIDWTDQWRSNQGVPNANLYGPITMESLLYIMGLDAAAALADYIGKEADAEEYRLRAEAVREAVRTYCIGDNGMVQDGPGFEEYSQHCQVFALLTDTLTGETAAQNIKETLGKGDRYAQCSVAMAYYLFRALEKADLYEYTDTCWDLWRDMVKDNLTTCVEDGVNARSDCHAWGALALYELPSIILGVRPTAPGYASYEVKPHPAHMTWAKGDVVTPRGMIHAEWRKEGNQIIIL